MSITDVENLKWSSWYPGDPIVVKTSVPDLPGVYEIRTDFSIARLKGESHIVSIGRATPSLKTRLHNRFKNPVRYLDRAEKWLVRAKHKLEFRFYPTDSNDEAKYLECLLHWVYEHEHWELPPGNERLEKTQLKNQILHVFGMPIEELANELLRGKLSETQVVTSLKVPSSILDNLNAYYVRHRIKEEQNG